jgi:nitric oxide reductase subunit B
VIDYRSLSAGQKVAVKYFVAAMVLFFAQIVFGLLAGLQFLEPALLYNVLDFNVTRMVHINAMIVWMLYGFIGSVYWLVEDESGVELVGAKLANLNFWIFTTAVAVVVVVFLVVQSGPAISRPSGSSTKAANTSRHRAGPTSASSCAC